MPKYAKSKNYAAREKWLRDKKQDRPIQVWLTISGKETNEKGRMGLTPKHKHI